MNNVIHPLEEAEYQPTIFLAGPISGTKEWQNSAIEIINSYPQKSYLAGPTL